MRALVVYSNLRLARQEIGPIPRPKGRPDNVSDRWSALQTPLTVNDKYRQAALYRSVPA